MAKAFASRGDLAEKVTSFTEIGEGLYAFTAEGDPNSGVIIGDDSVMVIEAQATPRLARKVIDEIRNVTDKPITHLALTHYHAVRVLGRRPSGPTRSSCPNAHAQWSSSAGKRTGTANSDVSRGCFRATRKFPD